MLTSNPPVLLSEQAIAQRVSELAAQIDQDYQGKEITAICMLKGGVIFFSDLLRKMKTPASFEFLGVSSYGNHTTSTGEAKLTLDLNQPLAGKHLLVVEDIVDSGLTISYVLDYLQLKKPASVSTVTLLLKPDALKTPNLKLDYVGFKIQNRFVVGYGLDYAEKYRSLPYIGELKL